MGSIKKKQTPIDPKNDDDRYFQYATTIPLNFYEIKKDPQRVSNIINYLSKGRDWKDLKEKKTTCNCCPCVLYYRKRNISCLYFKNYFKL